jgi:hypothetical protein
MPLDFSRLGGGRRRAVGKGPEAAAVPPAAGRGAGAGLLPRRRWQGRCPKTQQIQ